MAGYLIEIFGISLVLTLIVELLAAMSWGIKGRRGLFLVFLVNVLTNPAAVLCMWLKRIYLFETNEILFIGILELTVILLEGTIYYRALKTLKKPFLFSIIANGCSYFLGKLIIFLINGI